LLETFHLLSSTANAEKLFEAIAQSERSRQVPQSVEQLRQELGLAEAAH
jgi:PHD/YefM family antitoxin component YafN of YafNO toxin-antitoxin module